MNRDGPRVAFNQVTQQFTVRDGVGRTTHHTIEEMQEIIRKASELMPKVEPLMGAQMTEGADVSFTPRPR